MTFSVLMFIIFPGFVVSSSTGVKEMWKDLYSKDPSLLENFESFLCEVVRELKQSDTEKSTLVNHIKK